MELNVATFADSNAGVQFEDFMSQFCLDLVPQGMQTNEIFFRAERFSK